MTVPPRSYAYTTRPYPPHPQVRLLLLIPSRSALTATLIPLAPASLPSPSRPYLLGRTTRLHCPRIADLPPKIGGSIGMALPKIISAINKGTGNPDLNIVLNQVHLMIVLSDKGDSVRKGFNSSHSLVICPGIRPSRPPCSLPSHSRCKVDLPSPLLPTPLLHSSLPSSH
jgi:hypothetical protein